MDIRIDIQAVADQTAETAAALDRLRQAVYPPASAVEWPGRHLEWAGAMHRVLLWAGGGGVVAHAGLLLRDAHFNDGPVHVGGIGGVMTHPAARRQGYAAIAMAAAVAFFRAQEDVDFGLLVCEPRLLSYYGKLGWQAFDGTLLVRQRGETQPFTFNRVMTCPVKQAAPSAGLIDLLGPPW